MSSARPTSNLPATGFLFLCLTLLSTSFGQATVRTQLQAQSPTFVSVNAWITNSGPDTLKNVQYVWYMDWTDHGAALVPELDWASVSGVTMSATLRPDYIAEARYDLGPLVLAPGAQVQLNTRLHLKDWTSFRASNDWSFSGLNQDGTITENPFVAVYSSGERVWGYPEKLLGNIGVGPKIQVRTVKTQQSSNTLGMDVHFVNTGSVPVTGIVARWMTSTLGRTSPITAISDWTDADSLYFRQTTGAPGATEVDIDLGPTIIGVGRERIVKLRLVSSNWTAVDWSQDWSYSGLSPTAWNDHVEVEVRGYPSTGSVPDELDSDGDGWSDAQEAILGTDPANAANFPDGIPMKDGLVQDVSVPHVVTYDASTLPGYSTRKVLPLTIEAGAVQGIAPRITTSPVGAFPPPVFDAALQVGSTLELLGTIQPGHSLDMPIPLIDGLNATLPEHIQVVHFVNGHWQQEQVVKIENGAAYVHLTSFSPIAVGLVQQRNWLAAGDGFGLSIDKLGFPWSTGRADFGQLGDDRALGGDPEMVLVPVFWPRSTTVVAVAAGNRHGLALDAEGSVWAWGDNSAGQCGRASAFPVRSPVKVIDGTLDAEQRVVQIAAGGSSSYAVTVSGSVLSWGDNALSQLGRGLDGTALAIDSVPGYVTGLDSVRQVAAGTAHALALRANGTLKGWGSNQDAAIYRAALGSGFATSSVPMNVPLGLLKFGADTSIASGCSGPNGTGCWSYTSVTPWYLGVSSIAAGGTTSLAKAFNRKSSGLSAVNLAWGGNEHAQIEPAGTDSVITPVEVSSRGRNEISVGASHLLESWYDGYGYDPAAAGVAMYYPVQGRGYSYAANPAGNALANNPGWIEINRTESPRKRLHSSAISAGSGVSFSWNSGPDTVYAWGGPWGSVVTPLSRGERKSLTILSPKQGDTLPDELANIRVDYRIWSGDSYADEFQYLPRSTCASTTSCELWVTSQGLTRSVGVFFMAGMTPSVKPLKAILDFGKGDNGWFEIHLPYTALVTLNFWPLSDPTRIVSQVSWGRLSAGVQKLEANWVSNIPNAGSYGITLVYQYDDQEQKWDTLQVTSILAPSIFFPQTINSALDIGGPDTISVNLPSQGVLQGRLVWNADTSGGILVDGAWILLDSGQQTIAVWNISEASKMPIADSIMRHFVDWRFRVVKNGLRILPNHCFDLDVANAFRVNEFYSETPVINVSANGSGCHIYWNIRRFSSLSPTRQSEFSDSTYLQMPGQASILLFKRPIQINSKRLIFWSLGIHDNATEPESLPSEYRTIGMRQ